MATFYVADYFPHYGENNQVRDAIEAKFQFSPFNRHTVIYPVPYGHYAGFFAACIQTSDCQTPF
jgi:hypothetical protein